jgi:copper(I)-binding protein
MRRLALLCWIIALAAAPVRGAELTVGDLTIDRPWARASIGAARAGAAYLTIVNRGAAIDRLVSVAASLAKRAGLHSTLNEGGVMKMRPAGPMEIPPGIALELEPGGLHVMLMGLQAPLVEGESFALTLTFERAGAVEVTVPIRSATARHGM